ncbi:phosphatase PAP2 family protein [Alteribacter natronophilus]|uniref:phosphatase PAP2 family protein n=1 Tax=Alteribacter natronophilus TaxID=2583810 RepID=UPI00110D45F9|nr:phosphatase PAP2 family protein [Alteribacter natronophilus]TMW71519.1 phosphatase PAP2 family protein [Alteribacter natronophilus]
MIREYEISFLQYITSLQHPVADAAAYVLTFLGNELFYFLMVPLVYWCLSKAFGIRLVYVFLLSVYTNSLLKSHFAVERPVGTEGINSLFVSSAEVGSHYPYDSFPSGHAQGSATLWGMFAIALKSKAFWIFAFMITGLISFSRLYTGVHWPADVLTGIGAAAVILLGFIVLENWITGMSQKAKWAAIIAVPVLMMMIFPASEGISYGAFLLGAGVGFMMEARHVGMVIPKSWLKKAGALLIGLAGLFIIQEGIKWLLPQTLFTGGLRYGLIGLWGLWAAPWLFVKIGLYPNWKEIYSGQKKTG